MRLLLGLLLFCMNGSAQDSSRVIELPIHEPFDTSRSYQKVNRQFVYIISNNDLYSIFGYAIATKYWEFDFKKYHILGKLVKNEWIWQVRENKKSFIGISSDTKPGYAGIKSANGRASYFEDTLMSSGSDTARWYTHGHGDCFARFEYSVVQDKYYSTVILIEKNYWGGCRAGGSQAFTISFVKPKENVQYFKNTILMDKYKDQIED